jgi:uncharacterized protein YjbI with pentapeptide repeats
VFLVAPLAALADIYRWNNNNQIIAGMENIVPGPGVQLDHLDLAYASLSNSLRRVDLTGANFVGTNLSNAQLEYATLTSADFADAVIQGASFAKYGWGGISVDQLYSTASYKQKDLSGINFRGHWFLGADFADQNLTGAYFIQPGATFLICTTVGIASAERCLELGARTEPADSRCTGGGRTDASR